jgi:glucose-6-phosphate 1-dehydrogenase
LGLNTAQVGLTINVNGPGNPLEADPVELCTELAPEPLSAYASLFLDVMDGNATFFIRNDEAQEAWRIIDPIVAAWQKNLVPLQSYRAGSSGPSALR